MQSDIYNGSTDSAPSSASKTCLYTVGITQDGQPVLKLHDPSSVTTITLTMNEHATLQMIRMLEATLPVDHA